MNIYGKNMDYSIFCEIFNKQIFDNLKRDLIEKISNYSDRCVGLFRPTKPEANILQNLLQSNEIRFGDALEIVFEKYFEQLGFINLEKKIGDGKEYLDLDQIFKDATFIHFIEQKACDDHDSTKKRGQMSNFEKKIKALCKKQGTSHDWAVTASGITAPCPCHSARSVAYGSIPTLPSPTFWRHETLRVSLQHRPNVI
jgi:hypothetical protein